MPVVGRETHQMLLYADDINLLGDNINTIKKNAEALTDASNEVGLEVNTEKTMYMWISCHQNAGQDRNIKTTNGFFDNVAQFRYLGMTVRNQNLIHMKFKTRLNLGNCCYQSIQNILSTCLLSKNLKIEIYKNYNFACSFV
jgi:hypothetical protein